MKRLDRIQEIFNNASERQKRKKIDRMSWLEQLATKMRVLEMHRPIVLYLVTDRCRLCKNHLNLVRQTS